MIYATTPQSAIDSSIHLDEVIHWAGDPAELIRVAESLGYQADSVELQRQGHPDDAPVTITDVWGWTDETPENEQDWRVYVDPR